jgi:hypothetical protein
VQLARLTSRQSDKQGGFALVKELAARYPDLPEARFALIAVASEVNDQATINAEFDRLAVLAPKWDLPVAWETDSLRRTDPNAAWPGKPTACAVPIRMPRSPSSSASSTGARMPASS